MSLMPNLSLIILFKQKTHAILRSLKENPSSKLKEIKPSSDFNPKTLKIQIIN